MIRRAFAWSFVPVFAAFALQAVAAPPTKPPAKGAAKEATTVTSLQPLMDGFKWGLSPDEVVKLHNQVQGVFDKEYNDELVGMQPGIKMQEKTAERESAKIAFTALKKFDATSHIVYAGMEGEYTHGNKEAAHVRELLRARKGDRRFFFYIGDRLWKIYELASFGPTYGNTFQEVVAKFQAKVGSAGTPLPAAPEKGLPTAFIAWQDATTQLRLIDRSDEKKVGIVLEDKATLSALPQLRSRKEVDPTAELGADVAAATRQGPSDPNSKAVEKTPEKTPAGKGPKKR